MNRSHQQTNQITRIHEQQHENDDFTDVHVYQIFKDQVQFNTTDDQLQIRFEDLEIEEDKITSFGVSFWFTFNNSKFENNDTVFFQIGKNSLQKQMKIGFSKEKSLFVYFKTTAGNEIIYCEKKMYRNRPYFFKISVQQETQPTDVTVYVNGAIEVQQSLTSQIQTPRSCFWIGSEKASDCWTGSMWDCCFYNKWLANGEIKQLYVDNHDQNQTAVDIINTKQKTQNLSVIQNKRTGVPMNILKTTHQQYFQEQLKMSQPKLSSTENFQQNLTELSEMIFQNPDLLNSIRNLLFNYEWIVLTLQLLSPCVESAQSLAHQFHPEFMQNYGEIEFPLYVIQVNRLMLVIQKMESDISNQLLVEIAKKLGLLVKDKVYNECVIYDQLFRNLRNICMTKDEIIQIKKNYRYDIPELMEPIVSECQIEANDKLQYSFGNDLVKDETLNEIKIQQISAKIMRETHVILELNITYKNMRDGSEIMCRSILNTVDTSIAKDQLITTNTVDFSDVELITKMVARFSDKYGYLVGIGFQLMNGDYLYLGLLVDKDGTTMKGLSDDNVIEKDVKVEYSQFINCIEGQMFQIGECKFIGSIKAYTCSKQLFDKFTINEQNPINENEELPIINKEWLNGRMNIYVNYCHMCDKHSNTFSHSENTFIELFNTLGNRLKETYPNMKVIANFDKPNKVFENFDVYIKGIGEKGWRDELGRIFMLRKQCSLKQFQKDFDGMLLELEDQLAILVMGYGDTFEIEKMQDLHQTKYPQLYKKYKECKEHPAQCVNDQNHDHHRHKQIQLQNGMLMVCRH